MTTNRIRAEIYRRLEALERKHGLRSDPEAERLAVAKARRAAALAPRKGDYVDIIGEIPGRNIDTVVLVAQSDKTGHRVVEKFDSAPNKLPPMIQAHDAMRRLTREPLNTTCTFHIFCCYEG